VNWEIGHERKALDARFRGHDDAKVSAIRARYIFWFFGSWAANFQRPFSSPAKDRSWPTTAIRTIEISTWQYDCFLGSTGL